MNQLEPTNVTTLLFSVVFGPALAAVIGPYAVIIFSATVGAAWALGRRDPSSRLGAGWFFLRLIATAMILTTGLATFVGRWANVEETNWMLAPIALIVGGVGDDWPRLGRWILERVGRVLERKAGADGNGGAT